MNGSWWYEYGVGVILESESAVYLVNTLSTHNLEANQSRSFRGQNIPNPLACPLKLD